MINTREDIYSFDGKYNKDVLFTITAHVVIKNRQVVANKSLAHLRPIY